MPKRDVFVVMLSQLIAIEENRLGRFNRARIKVPSIRREKPRPAERFACMHDVGGDGSKLQDRSLECDGPGLNQIETMSRLSGAENNVARCESFSGRVATEQLEMVRVHSGEKRMICNWKPFLSRRRGGFSQGFHISNTDRSELRRSASLGEWCAFLALAAFVHRKK